MIRSSAISACGLVRANNEDSFLVKSLKGLFVVADGMGGGSEGELASAIVCGELAKGARGRRGFVGLVESVHAAISAANKRIFRYAKEKHYRQMGSTVAALLVDVKSPECGAVCHVGDSRVYRVRGKSAALLTRDHTVGCELSHATGGRTAVRDLGSRANPLSHVLTRAIGVDADVHAEWRVIEIEDGDRFLICSDGVHDVLSDDEIAAYASTGTLAEAKAALAKAVTDRGAPDNFTIVLADVGVGA